MKKILLSLLIIAIIPACQEPNSSDSASSDAGASAPVPTSDAPHSPTPQSPTPGEENDPPSVAAPAIEYSSSEFTLTIGENFYLTVPVNSGGEVDEFTVNPQLPQGLAINQDTGEITGTPNLSKLRSTYTVKAKNAGGVDQFVITFTVKKPLPNLYYSVDSNFQLYRNEAVQIQAPENNGGDIESLKIFPALPEGLVLWGNGRITGSTSHLLNQTQYTLLATNDGGSVSVNLSIEVIQRTLAPVLSLTQNIFSHRIDEALHIPAPANNGGPAEFSIDPALDGFNTEDGSISLAVNLARPLGVQEYVIKAMNSLGSSQVRIAINSKDRTPQFHYINPIHQVGAVNQINNFAIMINAQEVEISPVSIGGKITGATIFPALPRGLRITNNGTITSHCHQIEGVCYADPTFDKDGDYSPLPLTDYVITGRNESGAWKANIKLMIGECANFSAFDCFESRIPLANISFIPDTGYAFSNDQIFKLRTQTGWKIVNDQGQEIQMEVLDSVNSVGNPVYDFTLDNSKTFNYALFDPITLSQAGYEIPALETILPSGDRVSSSFETQSIGGLIYGGWANVFSNNFEIFNFPDFMFESTSLTLDNAVWGQIRGRSEGAGSEPFFIIRKEIPMGELGAIKSQWASISGHVAQDLTVVLRGADGRMTTLYSDEQDGENEFQFGFSTDELMAGRNYLEFYASSEIVSRTKIQSFLTDFTYDDLDLGARSTSADSWSTLGFGNWERNNDGISGAASDYIIQTSPEQSTLIRGEDSWGDYTMRVNFGVPAVDNDLVRFWVRVNSTDDTGPTSGYFFFMHGGGINPLTRTASGGDGQPNIGLARMDNGVVTILSDYTHPGANLAHSNLENYAENHSMKSNESHFWRLKFKANGNHLVVNLSPRDTTGEPFRAETNIIDITDDTYPTGMIAIETVSQVAWFDEISLIENEDRNTGLRIDTGSLELQSIDTIRNAARFSVINGLVIDHFGNGSRAQSSNLYQTSNSDGIYGTRDDQEYFDYAPRHDVGVQRGSLDQIPDIEVFGSLDSCGNAVPVGCPGI